MILHVNTKCLNHQVFGSVFCLLNELLFADGVAFLPKLKMLDFKTYFLVAKLVSCNFGVSYLIIVKVDSMYTVSAVLL